MRYNLVGQRANLIGQLMAVGAAQRAGYGYPVVGAYGPAAPPPGYPPPGYGYPGGGCTPNNGYCAPQAGPCMPPSPGTLVANGVDPRVYAVQDQCPTEARRYTLSFTQTIPAGLTQDVTRFPQVVFRGERLFVPSTIGANFDIVSITIGNRPQFAAAGSMPAEIFSEVSINNELGLDTAQPGVQVILQVSNRTAQDQEFRAVIIGAVIQ